MSSSSNGRRLAAAPLLAGLLGPVLAGSLFAAAPAQAQFFIDEPEIRLSPRAVVTTLARRGYRDITHPSFDGETYTLTAADPRGIRVRLVLDAFDGALLERARFEAAPVPPGFVGRPARPGYGWTEDEPDRPDARELPDARPQRVERARPPAAVAAVPRAMAPSPASAPAAPGSVPYGVNPDAPRPAPAKTETRAARTPDPARTTAPRVAPTAPVPPVAPTEAARAPKEEPKQEAARPVEPMPVEAKPFAPAPAEPPKAAAAAEPTVAAKPADAPAQPAVEPPQRQVRVIEGVTPPAVPSQKPAEPAGSGS